MRGNLCERGFYELFESDYGRRILVLDGRRWFAWNAEDGEEKLYFTSQHKLEGYLKIREGNYLKTNVIDDPEYPDVPHIYLEHKDHYHEIIMEDGLPNSLDVEKKILVTDNIYDKNLVDTCVCV